MERLLDLLAMKCGPSLRSISWPHICLQGINDLLRVFWWVGYRFGAPQVVRQAVTLTGPRDGGGGVGQHGCQEQDEKGGSSGRHCADFTVGCKEEKKQLSRLFDIVCQDVARRYAVPICVV